MKILDALNPQQRHAVTTPLGPVLVLAGPGSGKTRVLAHRIAYLVGHMGIQPNKIMAVTFTNKAAREMAKRVERLLGEDDASYTTTRTGVSLGTFHALCARILRREADRLPITREFVIFDETDQLTLIRGALKDINLDPKQVSPAKVHASISRAKNELIEVEDFVPDSYFAEITHRTYEIYQRLLRANNAVDFDDLLLYAVRLMRENDDLRRHYHNRYQHILVDEFQDTNTAQYRLLRLLTGEQPDLFVVGDPDQSIYRWRGADYRNVHRFRQDYPHAQLILLEQNYRSTQTILDTAMAIIDRNPNRQPKRLFTERGDGSRIILHEAYDANDEARYVVDAIAMLTLADEAEPGDCAVMYRTNAQSRALEEAFLMAGLPYRLVGAQRFYGRREIKDIVAYLRLIHNPHDQVGLLRVLNTPPRGIGTKTVQALLDTADRAGLPPSAIVLDLVAGERSEFAGVFSGRARKVLADFAQLLESWINDRDKLSLLAMFDRVLQDVGYKEFIDDGSEEGEGRWANVLELRGAAEEFVDTGLTTFLEHIALVSDQDTLTMAQNAPTLLTLHAAKGLEFPVVFIIGLDNGVLPHQRSFNDSEAMAEERRLFYVGITRAQDRLVLLRAFRRRQAGVSTVSDPSPFLDDLPPDLVDGAHPSRQTWDQISYQRQTRWNEAEPLRKEVRFHSGMRVVHPTFGEGIVISTQIDYDDEEVTVEFEGGETKHLVASMAGLEILEE
ncbi:MAG: UvrD-helicase domain-containing protein [Anaerolineales bacterium]|nr:UvrD-helicase domain-containing protein [Anaerolineales bacterium]